RLELTSRLQILSQLPSLEDRLDPADEGRDLSPELGVGFSGLEEVQELFPDEVVEGILSAELGLDLSSRFTLLNPDFARLHRPSSKCCSQKLRIASESRQNRLSDSWRRGVQWIVCRTLFYRSSKRNTPALSPCSTRGHAVSGPAP